MEARPALLPWVRPGQRIYTARMLLLRLLVLAFLAWGHAVLAAPTPQGAAQQGVVQVDRLGADVIDLQGDWGFAWQAFVDPAWTELPMRTFAPALGGWNGLQMNGQRLGPDGWGSYAVLVQCPAGERYAIAVPNERTAVHVFVNGRMVGAHGDPGQSPQTTRPAVQTRNPISPEFDCPLRVTVHMANYSHRTGGMFKPIPLGTADALAAQRERRVIGDAVLLGAYLLTSALTIAFFLVRREDPAPLLFGLFCIAIAVYADMTGERLLLRILPPELPWEVFLRIEWVSWFTALGLFTATVRGLFPTHVARGPVLAMIGVCVLGVLTVLALPGRIYSYLAPAGQVLTVVIVLHAMYVMARAAWRGSSGARLLVVGLAAILAALVADVVLYYFYAPVRRFVPVGAAVFVLMPAFLLVQRLARALGAEARTRTLEENARLREDVERMSRHDLKTPLNSIIGVARILSDDGRLPAEHRELVTIVERAGYRMLEMVNLSLGLFKMETGTYDFRAQAVNLGDVVERVLVDLQAFAQAARVTLRFDAPASPAYVRGEELLCYSAIANVVKNAIEATPGGASVTLRIEAGDPMRLAVHNPGVVPPEVAERFFEKYATAGKAGGTGLGAYTARLMAKSQEGELEMRSAAGAGTTLTLLLRPLSGELPEARADRRVQQAAKGTRLAATPTNILVVDDDEYNRLILRRYLVSLPCSVDAAENGREAVEAMERRWPDALLLDLEMPLMNGIEVMHWVRHQEALGRPRCAIIMLSSHDDEETISRCMAAGADHYLTKPASREALLDLLGEPVQGSSGSAGAASGSANADIGSASADTGSASADIGSASADTGSASADTGAHTNTNTNPSAAYAPVMIDPDLIASMEEFLSSRRELADAMDVALQAGDRERLRTLAHKAAGGLALYGFEQAAARCRDLELQSSSASVSALSAHVAWLKDYLGSVRYAVAGGDAG